MDRRQFLLTLFSLWSAAATLAPASFVHAKDGADSDSDSDSDSDDDGGSGPDDKDRDKDRDDDKDDDRDKPDDRKPDDRKEEDERDRDRDHHNAREAVGRGEILPLREILKRVETIDGGRVISVDLNLETTRPYYTLKVQSGSSIRTLKLEAATGRKLNLFGF